MPPLHVTREQCSDRHKWISRALYVIFAAAVAFVSMATYAVTCSHDAHRQAQAAESEAEHNGKSLGEIHKDVREIRASVFRIEQNGNK